MINLIRKITGCISCTTIPIYHFQPTNTLDQYGFTDKVVLPYALLTTIFTLSHGKRLKTMFVICLRLAFRRHKFTRNVASFYSAYAVYLFHVRS